MEGEKEKEEQEGVKEEEENEKVKISPSLSHIGTSAMCFVGSEMKPQIGARDVGWMGGEGGGSVG